MTTNSNERPAWFNADLVTESLDAREMLKAGGHPLAEVIRRTSEMKPAHIFELITPFTPVPLIEKIVNSGFAAYVDTISNSEIHTYFCKV